MRTWLMMSIISLLICHLTSAQEYSVRVTYNTNVRASYSLQARILGTAQAGSTLGVTGSRGDWLKINWQGREAWLADWVPMTRVESAANSPDVDNCCFVDRQCSTDQDWVDGYWAYQNNLCGAPPQTAEISSQQPVSETPATVNNCCFTGWQCHNDQDWLSGFYAFQENRCEHRGLAIEGSDYFVAGIEAALDLLKNKSSYWYQYAITGLDRIKENSGSGILGRTFNLTIEHVHAGATWLAGVIVHDACHVHRTDAGLFRYETPRQKLFEEKLCLELQLDALAVLLPGDPDPFGLYTTLVNIEDPSYQWWN